MAQKEVRPISTSSFKPKPTINRQMKKINFFLFKIFSTQTTRNQIREQYKPPEAYTVQLSEKE